MYFSISPSASHTCSAQCEHLASQRQRYQKKASTCEVDSEPVQSVSVCAGAGMLLELGSGPLQPRVILGSLLPPTAALLPSSLPGLLPFP